MLGALDEAAYIANPEKSDSMTHQSQGQYWAEPERLRDRRLKVRHRRFPAIRCRRDEGPGLPQGRRSSGTIRWASPTVSAIIREI